MKYSTLVEVNKLMERRKRIKSMMSGAYHFRVSFPAAPCDAEFERTLRHVAWPSVASHLQGELARIEQSIRGFGVEIEPDE